MPVACQTWRKAFTFQLAWSGHPVAPVYELGNGKWAQCALCGGLHDVTTFQGQEYVPGCVTTPLVYANYRKEWHVKYPDAAKHQRVWLVPVEEVVTRSKVGVKGGRLDKVTTATTPESEAA